MDNRAIGVFDSGIGGLTVVKELMKILPNEKIVYFGDTARVPYGSRSEETIKKFSKECISFLDKKDIKSLIIACNTVSAVAIEMLKEEFDMHILGVINPGSKMASEVTNNNRIGVIGTNATVNSGAYEKCIKSENKQNIVYSKACPLFVPIVEEGLSDSNIALETTKHYLEELINKNVDTLVMGCTHYPILKKDIEEYYGNTIKVISSGREAAREVSTVLGYAKLHQKRFNKKEHKFYISEASENFNNIASKWLNKEITAEVVKI